MATAVLPSALLANVRFQMKLWRPLLVGIGGSLASRKRALSEYLERSLDGPAIVHADDLWSTEVDRPAALEALGAELLAPLAAGRAGHVSTSSVRGASRRLIEPFGVVVVEGYGVLSAPLGGLFHLTVLVEEGSRAATKASGEPSEATARYRIDTSAPLP